MNLIRRAKRIGVMGWCCRDTHFAATHSFSYICIKGVKLIRNVFSNLLFVGNAMDVRTLQFLYEKEIKAVVDLAINEKPAQLAREMIYCRFPLGDGDGNSDAMISLAIRTVVSLIKDETRTLVACSGGMSRAPSMAAISIAMLTGRDPDECLIEVIENGPNDVSSALWTHIKRVYNEFKRLDHANVV